MFFTRTLSICAIITFFYLILAAVVHAATPQERIGLQNLDNREIVYCYANSRYSAEECASYFETKGYTRMTDIPYKMASYDFLTVDTYPTRRWRNGELTPRW